MRPRFWRRLAGCIAINGCLMAAVPEWRAGTGEAGAAKALVLEGRGGRRAVLAESTGAVTLPVADFLAARWIPALGVERGAILVRGTPGSAAEVDDLLTAVALAMQRLEPARLSYDGARISVAATGGACLASLVPLAFTGCREGTPLKPPIRSALQMVDFPGGLLERGAVTPVYPVQALRLGAVTILGLSGEVRPDDFRAPGRIVVPFASDTRALPAGDPRVRAAIDRILARVR
jgi:hypothetical protein